jgi:hypothetical protein
MLRSLIRLGFVRGLLGGNRGWLAIGAGAAGLKVLGRMAAKEPKVVYCEQLEPGQTLTITHLPYHVG